MTTVDDRARDRVRGWLLARRYGVPASMLEQATRRRLAGDWRGACAAAGFDVRFDLGEIRQRHGADVAARLEEDLVHLVPDLVRWHLPRAPLTPGLFATRHNVALAEYDDGVRLRVQPFSPHRVGLHVDDASVGEESWIPARYLWDARRTHELLHRVGGGDRTPFFHRDGRPCSPAELAGPDGDDPVRLTERVLTLQDAGEFVRAWRLGGVAVDDDFGEPEKSPYAVYPYPLPEALTAMVPALVRAASDLLGDDGSQPVLLSSPTLGTWTVVGLSMVDGQLRAQRLTAPRPVALDRSLQRAAVPRVVWQRMPDLDLLRAGLLTPAELHPLVRAALFPQLADPGYHPRMPTVDGADVRVRCGPAWHRVGWRDGRITAHEHTFEEVARERVMRSLGGRTPACVRVVDTWLGRIPGKLPRSLRALRAHAMMAVLHGNIDEVLRILDSGIDPAGLRDREGAGILHHLAKLLDGEDGKVASLLDRLLACGLDLNRPDTRGLTPLAMVLVDGGPPALAKALIRAGADPHAAVSTAGHYAETVSQALARLGVDSQANASVGERRAARNAG